MGKKRVVYFDVLNILAALSVVFMHCNGIVHTFTNTLAWKQALIVETCCYWAVPVFLMLSGANLMGYREKYSTEEFFKKRFMRTVLPFIVWSLISAAVLAINPFEVGFKKFAEMLIYTKIQGVYWFFIPLFSIYLSMPVLSLLKDNRKILWYMVGGGLMFISIIPAVCRYLQIPWNSGLNIMIVPGYLLFPIIGYLFATTDFTKKQRVIIYTLGVFGAALRYVGTFVFSIRDGALNKTFWDGYEAYHSVFLACAVFTFFKYSRTVEKIAASEKLTKLLKEMSACSFGIYLIHILVRIQLHKFITPNCWEARILLPFAIYGLSLLIIYIIKKIPLLKKTVP